MIDNWKDLIGFQEESKIIFYIRNIKKDNFDELSDIKNFNETNNDKLLATTNVYRVCAENIYCNLTEEELCDELDKLLTSFSNKVKPAEYIRCYFGKCCNKKYKNCVFYCDNKFDTPIIVASLNNKYGIFKHPDFNDFGFRVI